MRNNFNSNDTSTIYTGVSVRKIETFDSSFPTFTFL